MLFNLLAAAVIASQGPNYPPDVTNACQNAMYDWTHTAPIRAYCYPHTYNFTYWDANSQAHFVPGSSGVFNYPGLCQTQNCANAVSAYVSYITPYCAGQDLFAFGNGSYVTPATITNYFTALAAIECVQDTTTNPVSYCWDNVVQMLKSGFVGQQEFNVMFCSACFKQIMNAVQQNEPLFGDYARGIDAVYQAMQGFCNGGPNYFKILPTSGLSCTAQVAAAAPSVVSACSPSVSSNSNSTGNTTILFNPTVLDSICSAACGSAVNQFISALDANCAQNLINIAGLSTSVSNFNTLFTEVQSFFCLKRGGTYCLENILGGVFGNAISFLLTSVGGPALNSSGPICSDCAVAEANQLASSSNAIIQAAAPGLQQFALFLNSTCQQGVLPSSFIPPNAMLCQSTAVNSINNVVSACGYNVSNIIIPNSGLYNTSFLNSLCSSQCEQAIEAYVQQVEPVCGDQILGYYGVTANMTATQVGNSFKAFQSAFCTKAPSSDQYCINVIIGNWVQGLAQSLKFAPNLALNTTCSACASSMISAIGNTTATSSIAPALSNFLNNLAQFCTSASNAFAIDYAAMSQQCAQAVNASGIAIASTCFPSTNYNGAVIPPDSLGILCGSDCGKVLTTSASNINQICASQVIAQFGQSNPITGSQIAGFVAALTGFLCTTDPTSNNDYCIQTFPSEAAKEVFSLLLPNGYYSLPCSSCGLAEAVVLQNNAQVLGSEFGALGVLWQQQCKQVNSPATSTYGPNPTVSPKSGARGLTPLLILIPLVFL